jgi:hypothetical protein
MLDRMKGKKKVQKTVFPMDRSLETEWDTRWGKVWETLWGSLMEHPWGMVSEEELGSDLGEELDRERDMGLV